MIELSIVIYIYSFRSSSHLTKLRMRGKISVSLPLRRKSLPSSFSRSAPPRSMVWSLRSRKSLLNPIPDSAWHLWEEVGDEEDSTIPTEDPMGIITGMEATEIPTLLEAGLATEAMAAEAGEDSISTEAKAVLREALPEVAREAELGQEDAEAVVAEAEDGEVVVVAVEAVPDTIPTENMLLKNLNVARVLNTSVLNVIQLFQSLK